MILDYNFSRQKKELMISYINRDGQKSFIKFDNISRFKTYYYSPTGQFDTYDGAKAAVRYTDNPSDFDIKRYIADLPKSYRDLIDLEVYPHLYTWDIEVMEVNGSYSDAEHADNPVTTISVVDDKFNCIVMGTRPLDRDESEYCEREFIEYLNANKYYKSLSVESAPKFKYVCFDSEKSMLKKFLEIVAKVPVLAGWNSMKYDWQYVTNRIQRYYPDMSISLSSYTHDMKKKNYTSPITNEKVRLPIPYHTLVVDMMDIIDEDKVVMPIKESLGLDYIASESVSANKIEYNGTLGDLYNRDYKRYVFYNSIDSILVQLINYRFRTIDKFYIYGHYCTERLDACFSKIALTTAMVFKDFYKHGLKIVYEEKEKPERGRLIGAYVKKPIPGKYRYICCNDFASLYPSTIITCNISFENYVGAFYREDLLEPYRKDPSKYVVIGGGVYENEGSADNPKVGASVANCLDDEKLDKYRADKNYFVSVNGHVYKNDKEYTFKRIQRDLKQERNIYKYLAKKLDAWVIADIDHINLGHKTDLYEYDQQVKEYLEKNGWRLSGGTDMLSLEASDLMNIKTTVSRDIVYFTAREKALKNLGNSMYGGCSHVSFYWYNMNLANDITGEARNLIHLMERHIPEYFQENWVDMEDFHRELGITVDKEKCHQMKNLCLPVYGDSCDESTVITLKDGEMTIKELFEENGAFMVSRGKEFSHTDRKILNWNGREFVYNKIKWVIRHKTEKNRWVVQVGENCVYVTEDHSLIIIDNGIRKISPRCVAPGMTMMTTDGPMQVTSCTIDGKFDTYVYDIEVDTEDDNMHNFFGNGILIHNTDSVKGDTVIQTDTGKKTIEQFFNENYDNGRFFSRDGHELVKTDAKVLNWNDELKYCGVNYIMRHKVKKAKWVLKTKSGKEITVTNDHSMIVFRDGEKLEVKPRDILATDKILCVKD